MEENIVMEISGEPGKKEMKLREEDKSLLSSAAKWAQFISIVTFVCLGLGIVGMLFCMIAVFATGFSTYDLGLYGAAGSMYTAIMAPVMIFCLALYIVQLIPFFYLYRFAGKVRIAVAKDDEAAMSESFGNLRSYFKTYGIIIIVSLAVSVLSLIVLMIIGMAAAL